MCGRGSASAPSRGSARPSSPLAELTWPPSVGRESLMACRSDPASHPPVRRGRRRHPRATPCARCRRPRRRADPEQVLGEAKRRALTPEEAGRLLGRIPAVLVGPRPHPPGHRPAFGELAGLRCRRVHLDRPVPVLQVVEVRYQAGGGSVAASSPAPRATPASASCPCPAGVEAIRRQLPPGGDPDVLVFTGPGGGTRASPLARARCCLGYGFRRVYQRAVTRAGNDLAASTFAGPTTSATPSRPGWRTPASQPG